MEKKRIILAILLFIMAYYLGYITINNVKAYSDMIKGDSLKSSRNAFLVESVIFPTVLLILFLVSGIFVILNKNWIKIPLILFLGIFSVYMTYNLIFILINLDEYYKLRYTKIVSNLLIPNITLVIISISSFILALFYFKKNKSSK